jgi:hypothetical protein
VQVNRPIVSPLTVAICLALYGYVPGATRSPR